MSEENVPKLRLKPKLAADSVNASGPPPIPPPGMTAKAADEAKTVRLRPKLTAAPAAETKPNLPPPAAENPANQTAPVTDFSPPVGYAPVALTPETEKLAAKFTLKPRIAEEPGEIPPPPAIAEDSVLSNAPIPPPDFVDPEAAMPPPGPLSPRVVTARPFPPPPGNFPAPPAGGVRPAPPWNRAAQPVAVQKKKSPLLILVALVVLAGAGFFGYRKWITAVPTPQPKPPLTSSEIVAEKPKQEVAVPTKEVAPITPVATAPVAVKTAPPEPFPEVVEEPLPPPPPSAAFKAWVENLKIGGVRAGTNTRVFIGGTAYARGEVVNSQLGITFAGYTSETHMLLFKDQTGATVERRN